MSQPYSIIVSQTGQVIARGFTDSLDGLVGAGQQAVNQLAPTVIYCWWDGAQFQVAPEQPSQSHAWDWATKQWVDTKTLASAKAAKNEEINRARLQANRSFFVFQGKQIACDELSRSDIDGVSAAVALSGTLPSWFPGAWKAIDNTFVPIQDVQTWRAFVDAMGAKGAANFAHAQALKAQLAAATTIEQVEAITWETQT